jgi:alpha-1,3-rhamnosyl/mannosyltransferase
VRLVATIHDLTPFLFPHTFPQHIIDYLKFTMKKIIKKSLYISVPSQNTRDDILKMFSLSEDKVVVIYPSLVLSEPKQIAEDNPIKIDKYVLAVATNEPRKNFHRLIRAYAKLPQELKREYPLVIVGRAGWKVTGIDRLLEELQLKGNVFITGFVEENILAHLFKNASLFCYPSLYEGFGLPPLEAMFYGAPVLTSSVSSLPEIVGDSAYLVDPYSIDDISQGMNKLLVDESLRMKYKDAGNLQVKKYLDNGFAQKTLKLFESCL